MTISRGQMNRQLREGGGIMSLSKEGIGGGDYRGIDMGSRTGFGILKKISRGVKKVAKGVKKIAKSDVGKAALLAAGTYYLGGGFGRIPGGFKFTNIPGVKGGLDFLGGVKGGSDLMFNYAPNQLSSAFKLGQKVSGGGITGLLGKGAALAGLSTFLTSQYGLSPEEQEQELADPEKLKSYLRVYYTNLNPNAGSEEIEEFVRQNSADGGRIGFAEGPVLPPDPTQPVNPFGPKPGDFGIDEDIPIKMASNIENDKILEALFEKYLDLGFSPKEAADKAKEEFDRMSMMKKEGRGVAALGGRMGFDEGTKEKGLQGLGSIMDEEMVVIIEMGPDGEPILKQVPKSEVMPDMAGSKDIKRMEKAKGDTASMNAMQAAGVEGLPVRQNPKGVKELDLRKTGGFIPPVGIKEKADDIPAMLSNNEFVFTADAVRGAGGGDVNVGAQRMYDTMKRLEAGGKA